GYSTKDTPTGGHQAGVHGIPLDVAGATEEIRLDRDGGTLEPALPQMAHEPVAPMEMMHVGPQQACHQSRQRLRAVQAQKEMEMIAHQTIVIELKREPLAIAAEQLKEILTVFCVMEDCLAVVAAIHDMVVRGRTLLVTARPTCHGGVSGDPRNCLTRSKPRAILSPRTTVYRHGPRAIPGVLTSQGGFRDCSHCRPTGNTWNAKQLVRIKHRC